MLHLIFQSPIKDSVLQRIDKDDHVVFYENAVFQLNKASSISDQLQKMIENNVLFYVLSAELETRGFNSNDLISGIKAIDYSDLVKLTENNKVIRTWN